MKGKKSAPLGASLAAGSAILYASYGVWTRLMGNSFGGYSASAARSLLVLCVMVPLAAVAGQFGKWRWRQTWPLWVAMTGVGLLMWGPFYYAIVHAGVGVALTINYASYIVFMFALAWVFLGERYTRDKWVSTGLGVAGLYLVFTPNLSAGWVPLAAACLSGLCFAGSSVVLKMVPYPVLQSSVFMWIGSVVANGLMMLVVGGRIPPLSWSAPWFYLVLFAAASIGSSLMYIKALKLIEVGAAGILGLLEVVGAVVFGAVLFGEQVGLAELAGITLVLAAAAIPYVKDYNAQRGTLEEAKSS